jgi:hypothetical protein
MMQRRVTDRTGSEPSDNPFKNSQRYSTVGNEALRELGLFPIVKAWILGAAINLGAPAIILSPAVSQLPRTGFFATHGENFLDKIASFLFRSDNAPYAWVLLIGIAGVAIVRMLQLAGLTALVPKAADCASVLLLTLWCLYVLAVNGPVASPKYRLPMEPPLAVLSGAGFCTMRARWNARRRAALSETA